MDNLLMRYLNNYSKARVLIIDSKPRYKAQWTTAGIRAQYPNWTRGTYIPNSYRVNEDARNVKAELDRIWKGARVAIAQTKPGAIVELSWLEKVAQTFYSSYSDKDPRLIVVDELADFFEIRRMGGIFWQTARSGGELNVGLLAGSQRPNYIPNVVLTEADRLYLFTLDYTEDLKKVSQMGVPKEVEVPAGDHVFYYWNKFEKHNAPSGLYYVLKLE
jgi:hypothetical protein